MENNRAVYIRLAIIVLVIFGAGFGIGAKSCGGDSANITKVYGMEEYVLLFNENQQLIAEKNNLNLTISLQQISYDGLRKSYDDLVALDNSRNQENAELKQSLRDTRAELSQTIQQQLSAVNELALVRLEYVDIEQQFKKSREDYNKLLDRLVAVNNRTDVTTNTTLTQAIRVGFYTMWDEWWKAWH